MNNMSNVIIVGSGLAGLYAALRLDPSLNVTILTKGRMEESNSYLAQGGIAAVIDQEKDKPEYHFNDTLIAGANVCNLQALHVLIDEAAQNISNLQSLGVIFDQENGEPLLAREGGHSRNRILHVDGDATGKGIMEVLIRNVQSRSNIKIIEHSFCIDILMADNRCIGVAALEENKLNYYYARSVILATGGIGMIYGITTNACTLTGDAIAMAGRAGAEIKDMEFIQFHPTVFYTQENKRFLISEAVRGDGAFLKNIHGERFMHKYDQRLELAPRDVVSRAIVSEMENTQACHVFLDLAHLDRAHIFNHFPNIAAKCKDYGIDIATQMIPVAPAQHYLMGGIKTDLWARTDIPGLYACGETACTGVHGANRLASNSLLEALVFANRAAHMIHAGSESAADVTLARVEKTEMLSEDRSDVSEERKEIQSAMRKYAGIIRSEEGLNIGCKVLLEIENSLRHKKCATKEFMECFNMLTTAKLIVQQALKRRESIGAHYIQRRKREA